MSWTQGIQAADDLSKGARALAEKIKPDPDLVFMYIAWDTMVPDILHFDYYTKDGVFDSTVTLNVGKLLKDIEERENGNS